jgi:hypothetical protein
MNKRDYILLIIPFLILGVYACNRFGGFTDGATRIAYELKAAAAIARTNGKYNLVHIPKPSPEGCAEDYQLQFSKDSLIGIWCYKEGTETVTGSHVTTYHLNFVKVPETTIVKKKKGESTIIKLELVNGDVLVRSVE